MTSNAPILNILNMKDTFCLINSNLYRKTYLGMAKGRLTSVVKNQIEFSKDRLVQFNRRLFEVFKTVFLFDLSSVEPGLWPFEFKHYFKHIFQCICSNLALILHDCNMFKSYMIVDGNCIVWTQRHIKQNQGDNGTVCLLPSVLQDNYKIAN